MHGSVPTQVHTADRDRGTRMYISDQELPIKRLFSNVEGSCVQNIACSSKIRKTKDSKQDDIPGDATKTPYTVKTDSQLSTQKGSPWRRYREIMSLLDLGDKVLVASKRDAPTHRVGIRRFSHKEDTERILSHMRRLRHWNIVEVLEIFSGQKILYVVFEEMHMPLDYLVRSPRKRTSDEVGIVIGQV